ncbi:MAG: radical SAM protein [Candidatus Omnitrophica bacterium]|nr:radical SAM protein [Candidatus Omnitrophota bacterium]
MQYWLRWYPAYIEIEITNRCNMRCVMCEHTYWDEPPRDMSFDEFKYIVDQFPRLTWIGLTGIGESFLNKDFIKMLSYVKAKGIITEIYDTFYFVDKEIANKLIELKIDSIYASIDAATKETYEKIRPGSNFEKVIKNVSYFLDLRRRYPIPLTKFNFHYIVSKLNLNEILDHLKLVSSISKGLSLGVQFTRLLHNYPQVKDIYVEIPKSIIEESIRKGKELNIEVTWNANTLDPKPTPRNCIEWTMPFIFVSGEVIPCCAANEKNRRQFQKEYSMGNIFKQSFREIWRGKRYRILLNSLAKDILPLVCKDCCLYEEK